MRSGIISGGAVIGRRSSFGSMAAIEAPSMPVATTLTRIMPSSDGSNAAPKMMLPSGSTCSEMALAASSTSSRVMSRPPVTFTSTAFAPLRETSSSSGFWMPFGAAIRARSSPDASPVPIIALPITVMTEMGKAMMGTGEASGDDRALMAAPKGIQNPLLDEVSLKGAKAVLVNVTGGLDMTLLEVDEAANAISEQVDPEGNIIFGAAFDPSLDGMIRVSVVATGMDGASIAAIEPKTEHRPLQAPPPGAPDPQRATSPAPAEPVRSIYATPAA